MSNSDSPSASRPYVVLAAVAIDATADWALFESARLARGPGAELHVVHVVGQSAAPNSAGINELDETLAKAPAALQKRIERVWESSDPQQVIAHVRPGVNAADTILQAATDIGADIVVVGTHRRKGLEKLVLGSVAERVLREAHCPVLVAMPKDYSGQTKSASIEPPCPDCISARQATQNKTYWCERHSRGYLQPHVYEPSDRGKGSVMPAT